jgi:outer membrane biosynthesis protein TonB
MSRFDKDKQKGLLGTILFHALMLLCLFLLALKTPLPIPKEEGVEVDLGFSVDGMGLVQPDYSLKQQQAKAQKIVQPDEEEQLITQEIEDTPPVAEKKKEIKKTKPIKQVKPETKPETNTTKSDEPVKEIQKVDQRGIFKGNASNELTGGSEGITGKPGDQGSPDGLKDIKHYEGNGGSGNGPRVSLAGRGSKYLDKPAADVVERGDVVVEIWVDRSGVVKKAVISPKGTTIVNAKLRNIALNAALKSTFTAGPDAVELQKGTITYTFII